MAAPTSTMDAGWPRPYRALAEADRAAYERVGQSVPARVPAPWMNQASADDETVNWFACRDDSDRAHEQRLCQMCGEPLSASLMLPRAYMDEQTNGGGVHPRCMALALRFCPHFPAGDHAVVAYAYHGSGVGYEWPEGVSGVHEMSVKVLPGLRGLTRADVVAIAKADALGDQPEWAA